MARKDAGKLKAWEAARIRRNREYVASIRARTVCESCGAQPIQWHREEHKQHGYRRVGNLAGTHCSLERIDREIAACQAFCHKCHSRIEGRTEHLAKVGRIAAVAKRLRHLPLRPCVRCKSMVKKLTLGFCGKCYSYYRDHEMTDGWIVAIYFGKAGRERRNGFIHRDCAMSGEFNNLSACTDKADRMKRWKTRAGAERAGFAYQKNNPGSRCEPEPYHVGGRVEDVVL